MHKSPGIYSFKCRKPWSCKSKHINLAAWSRYGQNEPQKADFEHFGYLVRDMPRMSPRSLILSILAAWHQIWLKWVLGGLVLSMFVAWCQDMATPCQTPWSFRFNVPSLLGKKTILCLACGETDYFGGRSRSKRLNLTTFVDLHVDQSAASSKNPEALDLNPKSHGMCSFICRKPWSSQSKRINLMACVASYAENHGAVDLNV